MRNIKLILEYDGTSYHGWQKQPGLPTIQKVLEDSLFLLFQERVKTAAAGRTDAGVHAKGQVVNFITHTSISSPYILPALNSYLPKDIRVKKVREAEMDFHSRKSALGRVYRYLIYNGSFLSPFYRNFVWWVPFNLDPDLMRKAGKFLIGEHDFSSFQAQGSSASSTVREIKKFSLLEKGKFVLIYIGADSFLYKMARNIVGTLVEIGRKKITPREMKKILETGDRKMAGPTAPPQGLCLVRVEYGKHRVWWKC
ncbi:MAG: tRNA pseudouridine(38-40) synthase TruA [bacterium]